MKDLLFKIITMHGYENIGDGVLVRYKEGKMEKTLICEDPDFINLLTHSYEPDTTYNIEMFIDKNDDDKYCFLTK